MKRAVRVPLIIACVLVALKTVGILNWPWWLVTMPIWFLPALATIWMFVIGMVMTGGFLTLIALDHARYAREWRRAKALHDTHWSSKHE